MAFKTLINKEWEWKHENCEEEPKEKERISLHWSAAREDTDRSDRNRHSCKKTREEKHTTE
ncbi:hypothetical protein COCCADRAFT_93923 [Bipolaris zeicola 26-R-13]|uniref:Uncharacterized protein n=1 Tax=Cochliobolus carbonum (strain 26-R-13) TaxID=930089 RepID=W6YFP1_COCC2|nr:uncharacterized protein COCCADRAFT_93923 [Bipolaris zeicola 26-R-13]EUC34259.1 hypothetical protein COCCADRAFT_93923 [Bipolaris zeicola 26-R-13]